MLTKNLSLTLVVYIVFALALSATSYGLGHTSGGVSRREHGDLKRFIKKRAPLPQASNKPTPAPIPIIGAGEAPPTDLPGTSSVTSASLVSSTSESSVSTTLSSSSVSSIISSASSSSIPTTTSTTTSSSTTSSSSTEIAEPTSVAVETTPTSTKSIQTKTDTVVAAAATSSSPGTPSGAAASPAKSTILTVIIVVASSIGGVLLLWTVFRKWKLARSSKFDQRLQPIDWQPTTDGIMPTHHRRGSDTSSFHSGHGHGDATRGGYGATSDSGHGGTLGPLPDHDFTAGSTLAPVGGYADLSRGPSPQPQMQESLARGPSMTKPNYDAAVPLHHQASYGGRY